VRPEARPGGGRGGVQEAEDRGGKREGERCWKSGGGRVRLYTWRRAGLADEVGCDAMPDAAGGEGVTGPLNRKGQSTGRPLTKNLTIEVAKASSRFQIPSVGFMNT
jgi:hypothetical protein